MPLGASHDPASAQNQGGFAISPPTAELNGKPGETLKRKFDAYNNADVDQEFTTEMTNFTAGGAEGDQPVFTNDKTGYEMSSWMSVDPTHATIKANGGSVSVVLSINIPKTASPGGHFGALTVHPAKLATTGEVKIDPAITALILVNVAGAVSEKLSIADFSVQTGTGQNALRREKKFFMKGPIDFAVNLRNDGNIAEKPFITVQLKDQFGKEAAKLKVESPGNVLPHSNRIYRAHWKNQSPLGHYSAVATVTYGKEGHAMASNADFYAAPVWALSAIGALVLLIILLIVRKKLIKRAAKKGRKKKRKKKVIYVDEDDEDDEENPPSADGGDRFRE